MSPTQNYIESLISIQLAYVNTNHPDFIGGSAAIAMLERKHERRRREFERHRKHGMALSAARETVKKDSAAATGQPQQCQAQIPQQEESLGAKYSGKDSRRHTINHGRDGGFLTYFFGNPQSGVDSGSSRSNSPVRNTNVQQQSLPAEDSLSRLSIGSNRPEQTEWSEPNREDIEIELIRSLINSYFSITRKTVADLIPKTLMHMIVNHTKENIQNRLVSALYKEEMFDELLMEDEHIMAERVKCKRLLDIYRRGSGVLQDIF